MEKYDKDSNYYTDLCSKATTNSGTDITLTDRKNEFVENNMTLCEEDCDLKDYDYDSETVKCSCEIKIKLPLIDEIKFDKKKLYESFTDIKNIANLNLMKCYKEILIKDSIKKNYGLFIFVFINSFFYISITIFVLKSYNFLKTQINEIIASIKDIELINTNTSLNKIKTKNISKNSILETKKGKLNKNRNKKRNKKKNVFTKVKTKNSPLKKMGIKKLTKKVQLKRINIMIKI